MINVDYNSWKLPRFSYRANHFPIGREITRNGIHSFVVSDELPELTLDIMAIGFQGEMDSRAVIVGFNGALSSKTIAAGGRPPFFSGASLTKETKIPLLSISDPTMMLDRSITMAWYAGNRYVPDLVQRIADLLDTIAMELKVTLVLLGGSAGGFAALNVLARMTSGRGRVVCWNPQTSLAEYYIDSVQKYLAVAYKGRKLNNAMISERTDLRLSLAEEYGDVPYALPEPINFDRSKKIVYLQNYSDDFHTASHAGSWFNNEKFSEIGRMSFRNQLGNILFLLVIGVRDISLSHFWFWLKLLNPSPGIVISSTSMLIV